MSSNAPSRLRELLNGTELVVAPGVYDGLTARLVEAAGFPAAYMTGAGVAASLGYPDYGLVTMNEMTERAGVIARTLNVPLVSDADTGYGNELNVTRTVREFETRGVAAIHLEDQLAPKRCGHLAGKQLVSLNEYVSKIRAAVAARRNPDFLIIARSDARTVTSFDDAIERVNAALAAGADIGFVESPLSLDEVIEIPRRVKGPCLLNIVQGGRTPYPDLREVQRLGYKLAIVPAALLVSTLVAGDAGLATMRDTGMPVEAPAELDIRELFRRFGAPEWDEVRRRVEAV